MKRYQYMECVIRWFCACPNKKFGAVIIVILCIFNQHLQAQDLKLALENMRNKYNESDNMYIEMRIRVFEDTLVNGPYYDEQATIKRQNINTHYVFGGMEMLMNTKGLIVIDSESRTIMCSPRNLDSEEAINRPFIMDMDSIMGLYQKPVYLGYHHSVDKYSIIQKEGSVGRIVISIDKKSKLLSQLEYFYRQGPHVIIDFLRFDNRPQFSDETFNESKYVRHDGKYLKPTSAFSGYQVINKGFKF